MPEPSERPMTKAQWERFVDSLEKMASDLKEERPGLEKHGWTLPSPALAVSAIQEIAALCVAGKTLTFAETIEEEEPGIWAWMHDTRGKNSEQWEVLVINNEVRVGPLPPGPRADHESN